MTLRSSDLQSDNDLDSIRNSCDVYKRNIKLLKYFLYADGACVNLLICIFVFLNFKRANIVKVQLITIIKFDRYIVQFLHFKQLNDYVSNQK